MITSLHYVVQEMGENLEIRDTRHSVFRTATI
jgi:hypothetical protein